MKKNSDALFRAAIYRLFLALNKDGLFHYFAYSAVACIDKCANLLHWFKDYNCKKSIVQNKSNLLQKILFKKRINITTFYYLENLKKSY